MGPCHGCREGHRSGGGRTMTSAPRTDPGGLPQARPDQPAWLDPELATLTQERFSDPAWIFERKLDGERCLAFRAGPQAPPITRTPTADTTTSPHIAHP